MNDLIARENAAPPAALENYTSIFDTAQKIAKSALVPNNYRNKPEDIALAMMLAIEQGAPPLTSLGFIAVINGKTCWHSDALPGIAWRKGLIKSMKEYFDGDGDALEAVCEVTRPNGDIVVQRFGVADARKAGLLDKSGPWKQYPKRMLQWRARGWALRDACPHAFFGPTAEEMQDVDLHRGPDNARDVTPDRQIESKRDATRRPTSKAGKATHEPADFSGEQTQAHDESVMVWFYSDASESASDLTSAAKMLAGELQKIDVTSKRAFDLLTLNAAWIQNLPSAWQDKLDKLAASVSVAA